VCQEILKNRFPAQSLSQDSRASFRLRAPPPTTRSSDTNKQAHETRTILQLSQRSAWQPFFLSEPKQWPKLSARVSTGYEILRHTCYSRHSWVENLVDRHLTPSLPPNLTQIPVTAYDITHLWHKSQPKSNKFLLSENISSDIRINGFRRVRREAANLLENLPPQQLQRSRYKFTVSF
jgi:hypothetical protein